MSLTAPSVGPDHAPGQARSFQRPDIQGLRAVAVLAVLLDHLAGWPSGGFVGVDIFFVISGFLITGLLLREHERTGTISFRSFYGRRIKRILPASALVLFVTTVVASLLFPVTRSVSTMGDALWSLFFAGNWRFAVTGTDYFQDGALPSPLQHYWSLGVEEQFYLVWPWLVLAVLALVGWVSRRTAVRRGALAVTVLAIVVASFAWAQAETVTNPAVAYFSTVSRAWELGLGAFLAVVSPALARLPHRLRSPLAWVGLLGMVASILWLAPGQQGFPAPLALFPVVSAALVIVAGTGSRSAGPWPLTNPVSGYLGDISFSLYLWHWPVMVLVAAVTPSDGIRYYLMSLILVFVLSVCSYHLVEDPLRRVRWSGRGRHSGHRERWSIPVRTAAAVTVVSLAGVGIVLSALAVRWDRAGLTEAGSGPEMTATGPEMTATDPEMTATGPEVAGAGPEGTGTDPAETQDGTDDGTSASPDSVRAGSSEAVDVVLPATNPEVECLGAAYVDSGAECDGALGDSLWPSVETFAEDTAGQYPCWRSKGQAAFPDCELGDPDGTFRVALLGDSHAASYLPAIEAIAEDQHWTLDVFTGFACHWYVHTEEDNCFGPLQDANQALLDGEPYDAVLVTSSRYDDSRPPQERAALYQQAWEPVAERGTQIIVVTDVPATSEEAIQCLTRLGFSVTDNDCGLPRDEALAMVDPLPQVATRVEGAGVVDLTEYFCFEDFCPAVIGNAVVYRDATGHLSATYARSLRPYLEEDLLELLDP